MHYHRVDLLGDGRVTLTCFVQPQCPELPNQSELPAVIIFPGGGYKMLSERESDPIALNFLAKGYNVFILRYSVGEYGCFPLPLLDAFKAISYVRLHAKQFNVHPDKIALCGFSAGGHLAASVGTLWNRKPLQELAGLVGETHRPNALILGYPVITTDWMVKELDANLKNILRDKFDDPDALSLITCSQQVGSHTPPTFLFHTLEDQSVPATDSLKFAQALGDADIDYELHIFPKGKHGLSLATEMTDDGTNTHIEPQAAKWFELCCAWLAVQFT